MKNKIKILGVKKSEHFNYYIFNKQQDFFRFFRSFLLELELEKMHIEKFGRPLDKKWKEPMLNKEDDIRDYVDTMKSFETKEYNINLVFGKEKIFMFIYTKHNKQQKISKIIFRLLK
jgi:hypothetical protein